MRKQKPTISVEQPSTEVNRTLKTKHLSMIAIGGSIGTGLFVTSGSAISKAGPGGALLAYAIMGVMIYFLMMSLGEMATRYPVSGSFTSFATRFIDPAFGFALGWNYWLNWVITVAVDVTTMSLITEFWWPNGNRILISSIFFVLIVLLNLFSANIFGETEFWLSLIKVITVIIFIIVGLMTIFGIFFKPAVGLRNFTVGQAPFVGGLSSVFAVLIVAGFSFQGTELIGITAGESEDPKKSIPKAIHQVFWRILLFYIGAIFVIGAIIPYYNPSLLGASETNITMSPFTIVFEKIGLAGAASVMNAVILVSVLSSANSGVYASSRTLYGMGKDSIANRRFSYTNKRGLPMNSLVVTIITAAIILASNLLGPQIYGFLVTASGLTGFISWAAISICHYRFRKAMAAQSISLDTLDYKANWFPGGTIFSLVLCTIIIVGQGITPLVTHNYEEFIITYASVILFAVLFFYYKVKHHTKLISYKDIDLSENY